MSAFRRLSVLLVALLLVPSAARGDDPLRKLPDDVFAHPPDAVDVLLFGARRAAVVRVHVQVGTISFRASWRDFAIRLHAFLDRDDDGVLTSAEANGAAWTNLLTNPLNGVQPIRPGMRSTPIDANPRDGTVTFNELVNYLQGTREFEPLGAEAGAPPDPRAAAVFTQLDRDGDKVITPAELSATDGLVAKLDHDEDETLSLDELTPDRSPLADRFRNVNAGGNVFDPSNSPAIPLTSADVRLVVVKRLLGTFGKGAPGSIGPEPLGADPTAFKAADGDCDRRLDRGELTRYLEAPTIHLELLVTLPPTRSERVRNAGRIAKLPARDGAAEAGRLPTRTGADGALVVEVAGSEIEFIAFESRNNLTALFKNQFRSADANKDGAIDARELRESAFLQRFHAVSDRNGDGKMTESEFNVYLDLNNAAEEARIVLTVSDQGVALQERLDADHDGRLSVRELRGAQSKLANLDADHDGRLSLAELPRRTQLNFGRGPSQNRNRIVVASAVLNGYVRVNNDRPNRPAWFVGMDRNHDGDVSPREFLGASDQFRKFDADGDGLIDGEEAAAIR